jgi:rRNA maturation endonuclease Nob1
VRAVLDTSAILEGFEPMPPAEFVVPPAVVDEVSKGRAGERMRTLVEAGLLIIPPSIDAIEEVISHERELGEDNRLSMQDVEVIALAMELGIPCVTDDYSVQNVSQGLGVEALPFKQEAIRQVW